MEDSSNLMKIRDLGQSIWLDYLRRELVQSGQLQAMIEEDGLRGVTSNPKIFEQSITGGREYERQIAALASRGASAKAIYAALTISDVQMAADVFRPVYEDSGGQHGFVSLEVDPHLALDTEGTLEEARRLWTRLNRPNVFIKVPATLAGIPAIETLIREGINVNVTLLFGLPRYREVANAYIAGIEGRVEDGNAVDRVASVASFFLSRIDAKVDPQLEEIIGANGEQASTAAPLRGEIAIASARHAYQIYEEIVQSSRFQQIAENGAKPQRLLWASTGTKNPEYSDLKYVEALIGPGTINTLPPETFDAFRDHGSPAVRLTEGLEEASRVLDRLEDLGIDMVQVCEELEAEGIEKFKEPYDRLCQFLQRQRELLRREGTPRQSSP